VRFSQIKSNRVIMPFRKLLIPVAPTAKTESTAPAPLSEVPGETPSVPARRSLWRTGLLLTTSAALGGIAVAIWNRRTLAHMRQQSDVQDERSKPAHGGPKQEGIGL
jgi:hypothetical protein